MSATLLKYGSLQKIFKAAAVAHLVCHLRSWAGFNKEEAAMEHKHAA